MVTVTGDPLGALIPSIVFSILGLFITLKPELMLKFHIWSERVFMGAKYIPGKRTYTMVRLMGISFFIVGLFCLYLFLFADFK